MRLVCAMQLFTRYTVCACYTQLSSFCVRMLGISRRGLPLEDCLEKVPTSLGRLPIPISLSPDIYLSPFLPPQANPKDSMTLASINSAPLFLQLKPLLSVNYYVISEHRERQLSIRVSSVQLYSTSILYNFCG